MSNEQMQARLELASAQMDGLLRLLMKADMALAMATHWQICDLKADNCEACRDAISIHHDVYQRINDLKNRIGKQMFEMEYKWGANEQA